MFQNMFKVSIVIHVKIPFQNLLRFDVIKYVSQQMNFITWIYHQWVASIRYDNILYYMTFGRIITKQAFTVHRTG